MNLQHKWQTFAVIEILLSQIYRRMKLMVVCWYYWMPFHANGSFPTPINVIFYAKILNEWVKIVNEWDDSLKWIYFRVNEFEVGANDKIFSGNKQ